MIRLRLRARVERKGIRIITLLPRGSVSAECAMTEIVTSLVASEMSIFSSLFSTVYTLSLMSGSVRVIDRMEEATDTVLYIYVSTVYLLTRMPSGINFPEIIVEQIALSMMVEGWIDRYSSAVIQWRAIDDPVKIIGMQARQQYGVGLWELW